MTRTRHIRAGRHGEREGLALARRLAAIGWWELPGPSAETRDSLLTAVCDKLPGEIQADLPPKQVWTPASTEDMG